MVRVECLSKEEIGLRERTSRFLRIADEFFTGGERIDNDRYSPIIKIKPRTERVDEDLISIDVSSNLVSVYSSEYFEMARNLAERYEFASPALEFTVKKMYRE